MLTWGGWAEKLLCKMEMCKEKEMRLCASVCKCSCVWLWGGGDRVRCVMHSLITLCLVNVWCIAPWASHVHSLRGIWLIRNAFIIIRKGKAVVAVEMLLLQRAMPVCASLTWLAGTWRKLRARLSQSKSCWRRGLLSKKSSTGSSMWWVQNVICAGPCSQYKRLLIDSSIWWVQNLNVIYAGPCSQYKMMLIDLSMWWVQKVVYRFIHMARTKCQWNFTYSKYSPLCSLYKTLIDSSTWWAQKVHG